jgi:hypothetical protein
MENDNSSSRPQTFGEGRQICIADIADELQKLARSGGFPECTVNACVRGAWLLRTLREVIFKSGYEPGLHPSQADALEAFNTVRDILIKNGE